MLSGQSGQSGQSAHSGQTWQARHLGAIKASGQSGNHGIQGTQGNQGNLNCHESKLSVILKVPSLSDDLVMFVMMLGPGGRSVTWSRRREKRAELRTAVQVT